MGSKDRRPRPLCPAGCPSRQTVGERLPTTSSRGPSPPSHRFEAWRAGALTDSRPGLAGVTPVVTQPSRKGVWQRRERLRPRGRGEGCEQALFSAPTPPRPLPARGPGHTVGQELPSGETPSTRPTRAPRPCKDLDRLGPEVTPQEQVEGREGAGLFAEFGCTSTGWGEATSQQPVENRPRV